MNAMASAGTDGARASPTKASRQSTGPPRTTRSPREQERGPPVDEHPRRQARERHEHERERTAIGTALQQGEGERGHRSHREGVRRAAPGRGEHGHEQGGGHEPTAGQPGDAERGEQAVVERTADRDAGRRSQDGAGADRGRRTGKRAQPAQPGRLAGHEGQAVTGASPGGAQARELLGLIPAQPACGQHDEQQDRGHGSATREQETVRGQRGLGPGLVERGGRGGDRELEGAGEQRRLDGLKPALEARELP